MVERVICEKHRKIFVMQLVAYTQDIHWSHYLAIVLCMDIAHLHWSPITDKLAHTMDDVAFFCVEDIAVF